MPGGDGQRDVKVPKALQMIRTWLASCILGVGRGDIYNLGGRRPGTGGGEVWGMRGGKSLLQWKGWAPTAWGMERGSDLPVPATQSHMGAGWPILGSDSLHPGSAMVQEAPGKGVGSPPKRRWLECHPAMPPPKQLKHMQL